MRRGLARAMAVAAVFALSSPSVVAGAVAFHLAHDDHHAGWSHPGSGAGLEIALHGHAHHEKVPAHGHPVLVDGAAPIPGRLLLLINARVGDTPEVVVAPSRGRLPVWQVGPTHDPPRRPAVPSVLRI